jgi:hypothetical protein
LENEEYTDKSQYYPTQSSKTTRIQPKEARTRKYECTHITQHANQAKSPLTLTYVQENII